MMEKSLWQQMGLTDEEYAQVQEILGREPNYIELGLFAVMWSEHCGYKNSRPVLKYFPTEGSHVIEGPGENAGVVDIGDNQALVFKIESHNHPAAVEPYQGAAVGVGGIVRDIYTMGARPIASINSLRFGPLDDERIKNLLSEVVSGIGDYGHGLGIPTAAGEVYFDECYRDNPVVNTMCVGLVVHDEITRAVPGEVGSSVMLVGSPTGRDGMHGAAFASGELSDVVDTRPSVSVGEPVMGKSLMEACLEVISEGLVVGMQGLGAAGLTSSAAEIASKGKRGIEIDVSRVPRREEGMTPYEVMLSESQERMLLCPRPGKEGRIREIFDKWGLDAAVIGKITGDGVLRVTEGERVVAEIPAIALTDMCPVYHPATAEPAYYREKQSFDLANLPEPDDYNQVLKSLLASPNIASKEWIYTQYDYQAANTVLEPVRGDAAVLSIKGTPQAAALTVDGNSRMVYLDPFMGGIHVVCEAARNLACTGARPLALTYCLNFGSLERPEVFWQFENAVRGMAMAAYKLNIPVVNGNISFYNEADGKAAIYPTPVAGMVGLIEDVNAGMDMAFKHDGDVILLLGGEGSQLGGSEFLKLEHGLVTGEVPVLNLDNEKMLLQMLELIIRTGMVTSCHDLSEGGLAVALAEAAIQGRKGFRVHLDSFQERLDVALFNEAPTRTIVTLPSSQLGEVLGLAEGHMLDAVVLGEVGGDRLVYSFQGREIIDVEWQEAASIWRGAIRCSMV